MKPVTSSVRIRIMLMFPRIYRIYFLCKIDSLMVIYMFVSINCRGGRESIYTSTFSWLLVFWLDFLFPSWRHLVLNIKTTFRTVYREWVWKVRIWSPLLKKFLMEKFIICAVNIPLAKILFLHCFPVGIYLLKVNNRNTKNRC